MTTLSYDHKKFFVAKEDKLLTSSSSKGNQDKWMKDGYWLKADFMGYEGMAEYASSQLYKSFGVFDELSVVEYGLCTIHDEHRNARVGCYCKNFLLPGENMLTLGRLLMLNNGSYEKNYKRMNSAEKYKYVVDVVTKHTGLVCFEKWLAILLQWDAFILNEDRHLFNIGVIMIENSGFKLMPIFDNGAAFFSDTSRDYPLTQPLGVCYKKIKSKPFSTNFSTQLRAFPSKYQGELEKSFILFPDIEWSLAEVYYNADEINRVKAVIKRQMAKISKI